MQLPHGTVHGVTGLREGTQGLGDAPGALLYRLPVQVDAVDGRRDALAHHGRRGRGSFQAVLEQVEAGREIVGQLFVIH